MNSRVLCFASLATKDPDFKALTTEMRSLFPHTERFQTNFFSADHDKIQVKKSCRNQSYTQPIDFVFHSSCKKSDIKAWEVFLKSNLSDFKSLTFHTLDQNTSLNSIKSGIIKRREKPVIGSVKKKNKKLKKEFLHRSMIIDNRMPVAV